MPNFKKTFSVLFFILLLANVVGMIVLWTSGPRHFPFSGPPKHIGGPGRFLMERLELDSGQKIELENLQERFHEKMRSIREKQTLAKEAYFELLKDSAVNEKELFQKEEASLTAERERDLLLFEHFGQVRKLCRPTQKAKFDSLINELAAISQPRPGPPPGRPEDSGPRNGPPDPDQDGPPPPRKGEAGQ